MDLSTKRNKSLSSSTRKSVKRNSFGESGDFPIRHLTKSEYMKIRNIPLLEHDIHKQEDLNPTANSCHPTTNPKKFFKEEPYKETTKKKIHNNEEDELNQNFRKPDLEKELLDERRMNKKLVDELTRSQNEKEDLQRQIKLIQKENNVFNDKLQESYEQKVNGLREELQNSSHYKKEFDDIINNNKQLRKENESLYKENQDLRNFKEKVLAENFPEKNKALLEEKDRRFRNLETMYNNEKENNELLKEKNKQLINENKALQERMLKNETFDEKFKALLNENQALKFKNQDLENLALIKSQPNPETQEKLTLLASEITRLQSLLHEHEKVMRDKNEKHASEIREKDLRHERLLNELKEKEKPIRRTELEKELKELADHYNDQKKMYEGENAQLRKRLAELAENNQENLMKLEKLQMAVPLLGKENELWRQKYTDLEKEHKAKTKELEDLKKIEPINSEILRSDLKESKKKGSSLEQELSALQQALQQKDKEINLLKSKLQNQNNFCEQLKNELNLKQQDIMLMDKRIKDLIGEIYAMRQEEPAVNEQRKKEFHEKIKELEEKIILMVNENQRLTEIIKEKVDANEYLSKLLKDKLDENDHLKDLLSQAQNLNSMGLENAKNELEKQKNKEIEKAVKEITMRFLNEKAENDKEMAQMKVYLNDLQNKLAEKDEELRNYRSKPHDSTKSPLKMPNQYYEDENKFLHQEKKNLEAKIMQLLWENDKMKKKFDEILQDNRNISRSASPIKAKNEQDPNSQGLMNKIAELDDKLQTAEKEKQRLIHTLGEKQRENEILNSKLSLADQLKDKEISEIKKNLEREHEHAKKAAPQDLKMMANKMKDLEKQVEMLENELYGKNQDLKNAMNKLEQAHASIPKNILSEKDFDSCFEENVKLEGAKIALEGEVFKLQQKINDLNNHNQMLKNDIYRLEDEIKAKNLENKEIRDKLTNIEERPIKELEELRRQIENYKKQNMDIREINMKFQTEKENHDNQINMFRKLLENKDKELEKTYDLLNLRKNELENLTKEYNDLRSEKLDLSLLNSSKFNSNVNDYESVRQVKNLANENEELQKLVMYYKSQCDKKDKEFMKKSQEIESKINDIDQLRKKYIPETKSNIRYYTPSPSRINNPASYVSNGSNLSSLKLNFDYNS